MATSSPPLPVLGVQPAPVRRQRRSLHKGNSSGQSCLAEVESCQNMKLPNHHLNQGPTHLKPSLSPRPWSPVSLPWPDRDRKPLQHFLLFPAYKFCERKLAITRFQKKKNKREKRETNIKKTIKRSRRVGFNHHQSKTPTLASEQRNARHLNHHVGCPQKWPDCRPVAS